MPSTARIVLLLVAGCGFQPGAATTAGDGARPIDASLDSPIDGSPNLDTDGDGVKDSVDNCIMTANADQHDEDQDGVGDACDRCPQISHEPALDSDGDGLPDACDPHINAIGDALLRFDTFAGTALPAGWTVVAGNGSNLTFANDAMTINASGGTQILGFDTGHAHYAIDTGATLPAPPSGTTFTTALTNLDATAGSYIGCGIRLDLATRELFDFAGSFTTLTADPDPEMDSMTFPGPYQLISIFEDGTQTCSIPGPMSRHLMVGHSTAAPETRVGIRIGNAAVKIRYVAIYTF